MAVTRKVISIEQMTITVPIGETITLNHIPDVLYVNYNTAPYHGYLTFTDTMKRELLVLNPRTGASPTNPSSAIITNSVEKIKVDDANGKKITNIPTDIQQEVLLKGGIKNGTSTNVGNGETAMTYEPLVFYISILVGGIDWRPASRFPSEIDLIDANMKEPVTSSDIPAVDAYQYLISLQTRSQSEDYMLESLKQSLAKKMILARDINYLGACVLAVERVYFDLIRRLGNVEERLNFIENTWLPELEARLFTTEINIKNLWNNLLDNWNNMAAMGYYARHDAYWRVHAALRHYGSHINNSTAWTEIPIFGNHYYKEDEHALTGDFTLSNLTNYPSYSRNKIDPETGTDDPITIKAYDPESSTIEEYKKNVVGLVGIKGTITACFFHGHNWEIGGELPEGKRPTGSGFYGKTHSGNDHVLIDECFHNLVVKDDLGPGTRGAIITNEHIGYYYRILSDEIGNANKMAVKISGSGDHAKIQMQDNDTELYSESGDKFLRMGASGESHGLMRYYTERSPYVFFGRNNKGTNNHSTGFTVQPPKNENAGPYSDAFITADRIFFADMDTGEDYMNFASKNNYTVMNFGKGEGGFYIGKTDAGAIIEYESEGKYCGLAFTSSGLKFYGISADTISKLSECIECNCECTCESGGEGPGIGSGGGTLCGIFDSEGHFVGTITPDSGNDTNVENNTDTKSISDSTTRDSRMSGIKDCGCGKD